MTKEEIKKLHNFDINERDIFGRRIFEKAEGIDAKFIRWLDRAVTIAKLSYGWQEGMFIVHDINQGKHSPNSYHYKGLAVDGHFVGLSPIEVYIIMSKMGVRGFGYYPDWQHPGFHFDLRPQDHISTWLAYNVNGKQTYDYDLLNFIGALTE